LHPENLQAPDPSLAIADWISQRTFKAWINALLVLNQAVPWPETLID